MFSHTHTRVKHVFFFTDSEGNSGVTSVTVHGNAHVQTAASESSSHSRLLALVSCDDTGNI